VVAGWGTGLVTGRWCCSKITWASLLDAITATGAPWEDAFGLWSAHFVCWKEYNSNPTSKG
jgi:hypothetical protein